MRILSRKVFVTAMLLPFVVAGCSHRVDTVKQSSIDAQVQAPKPSYASGSLWQENSTGLAEDLKARRRGDIITVVISEQASASKQSSTGTSRGSNLSAGFPKVLGLERLPIKSWADLGQLLSASYDTKFEGSGSTSRQETLQATISAKVVDVHPNGNLQIEGRRNVKVNSEDQIIVVTGTVRSRDIGVDNTVNSSLIADANIAYSGKGVISDRQSPGWLLNILDYVWPF